MFAKHGEEEGGAFVLNREDHMGGCQNYAPLLGSLNNRCHIIIGTPKGTITLTTTHIQDLLSQYPDVRRQA